MFLISDATLCAVVVRDLKAAAASAAAVRAV